MRIQIKYFKNCNGDVQEPVEKISKGDWIDLRSNENYTLKKGETALIRLGVGMKIPEGYEAHLVPRSSTFKKWHIIQTNSCGIIDNSYSGDNDEWMMPVLAMEDTVIVRGDRVCQFRIIENQPAIEFETVDTLNDTDRGGFGSTGSSEIELG